MTDITVEELARRRREGEAITVIDIREPWEVAICSLPDAIAIPMATLAADPARIAPDREVVLVCHAGGRSDRLAAMLVARGYTNVRSLRGGIDEWARTIDPSMARY